MGEVARFRLPVDVGAAVALMRALAKAYKGAELGPQVEAGGAKWATVVVEQGTPEPPGRAGSGGG